jgi:hypothetical protein
VSVSGDKRTVEPTSVQRVQNNKFFMSVEVVPPEEQRMITAAVFCISYKGQIYLNIFFSLLDKNYFEFDASHSIIVTSLSIH